MELKSLQQNFINYDLLPEKNILEGIILAANNRSIVFKEDNKDRLESYSVYRNWDIEFILNRPVYIEVVHHLYNKTQWDNNGIMQYHKCTCSYVTKIIEKPKTTFIRYA